MTINVEIINSQYSPNDHLIIENYSGYSEDHSELLHDTVDEHDIDVPWDELDASDWIVIIDGTLVEAGEFTAHTIHAL